MRNFVSRPTRQPYVPTGLIPTTDPITSQLFRIGQVGPRYENRWMMNHGRFLSGLGSNDTQPGYNADTDRYVESLEQDDDVNGSGMFDTYGRKPTVNATLGVFQDHPSIPGYIDREVQYAVSREVVDISNGADVVTVAGGGLTYQERGGLPVPFDRAGQGPSRPAQYLSQANSVEDVFVGLTDEPFIPPMVVAPVMPDLVVSRPSPSAPAQMFAPPSAMSPVNVGVPAGAISVVGRPSAPQMIPSFPAARPISSVNTSLVSDVLKPIAGPNRPISAQAAPSNRPLRLIARAPMPTFRLSSTSTPYPPVSSQYTPQQPPLRLLPAAAPALRGFGADDTSTGPGIATYAFAGLLVGAAAAMVWHASKGSFGGAK